MWETALNWITCLKQKKNAQFRDDYKNKPLVPNKKLDNNLKMNKIETTKCVLQHKVCDICIATGDIFEQFHLLIFLTFNLFVSIRIN